METAYLFMLTVSVVAIVAFAAGACVGSVMTVLLTARLARAVVKGLPGGEGGGDAASRSTVPAAPSPGPRLTDDGALMEDVEGQVRPVPVLELDLVHRGSRPVTASELRAPVWGSERPARAPCALCARLRGLFSRVRATA